MARIDLRSYRKARSPFGSLMRLFRYFKHCRLLLICAVASILAYAAATIAASYCMKPLVNLLKTTGLAPDAVYAKYLALLLGLAGLYVLSVVTNYLLNRLMLECSTVIMRALRTELFDKMQRLPIRYFDENTNGSLMSYFTNDIEATNELLQHSITQMMISVMSLLGTVGMMLALSMRLFSLMVVLAAIVILVVRFITKKSSRSYRQQQQDAANVNGFVEEIIAGQRDVKVFTHEQQVMRDFEPINERFRVSSTEATTVTSIVGPILNNLSHFFYALTCAVGVLWLKGENAGAYIVQAQADCSYGTVIMLTSYDGNGKIIKTKCYSQTQSYWDAKIAGKHDGFENLSGKDGVINGDDVAISTGATYSVGTVAAAVTISNFMAAELTGGAAA